MIALNVVSIELYITRWL